MHLTKTEIRTGAAALALAALGVLAAISAREPGSLFSRPLPAAQNAEESRLNINTASAAELAELPELASARIEGILARRQQSPLTGPEDLLSAPGMNREALRAIEDYITYEGVSP